MVAKVLWNEVLPFFGKIMIIVLSAFGRFLTTIHSEARTVSFIYATFGAFVGGPYLLSDLIQSDSERAIIGAIAGASLGLLSRYLFIRFNWIKPITNGNQKNTAKA